MKGRKDFLGLKDLDANEINDLLIHAVNIKTKKDKELYLKEKNIGLLFTLPSTRTRVSFQVGCQQLGGMTYFLDGKELQITNGESLKDTAKVLSRYLDALIVRMYDMQSYGYGRDCLNLLAENSHIPIINALDDKEHPCQVLADLLTLKEKFGNDYKKKTITFTWVYSKRQKSLGVPHSLLCAAGLLGMNVRFVYPRNFDLDPEYVLFAKNKAKDSKGNIEFLNDLSEGIEGADCVYAKNWKSLVMDYEEEQAFKESIKNEWYISEEKMQLANKNAFYMDCMPFIRGEQVSEQVVDGNNSIIYDQAENRLHVQKAIMTKLMKSL